MIVLTTAREINAAVKSNTYGASRGHRRSGHVYCQAPGHADALRVIGAHNRRRAEGQDVLGVGHADPRVGRGRLAVDNTG